jgi:hypothetical protein
VFFLQNEKIEVILLVMLLFSAVTHGELLPSTSLNLLEIHLIRCLTYIGHRYFPPGQSVVITSPAAYRDEQQELVAEIHRNSIWPVVVTVDGNISIHDKSDFIDRDDSYIILIPDGNIKIIKAEINRLDQGRVKFKRSWNSEARFVVAGAKNFQMPQKKYIFDFLSKLRIYNCIILSPEHNVTDKEYSRP